MHPTPAVFIASGAFMKFKKMRADEFFSSKYHRIFSPAGVEEFLRCKKIFLKNKKFASASSIGAKEKEHQKDFLPENKNYKPFYGKLSRDEEDEGLPRIYRYSPSILTSVFPIDSFLAIQNKNNLFENFDFILNLFNGVALKILPILGNYSNNQRAIKKIEKIKPLVANDTIPLLSPTATEYIKARLYEVEKILYCWDGEEKTVNTPAEGSPFPHAFCEAQQLLYCITEFERVISYEIVQDVYNRAETLADLEESQKRHAERTIARAIEYFISFLWYLEMCLLSIDADPQIVSDIINEIVIESACSAYMMTNIYAHPDLVDLVSKTGLSYSVDHTDSALTASAIAKRVSDCVNDVAALTGVPLSGTCGYIINRAIFRNTHTEDILDMVDVCVKDCIDIADGGL
jgi:hypothetical protein